MTRTIDLPDDEPDIVFKMIQFLYTSSYDDTEHTAIPGAYDDKEHMSILRSRETPIKGHELLDKKETLKCPGALIVHTKVYIIADKYDIQALKDLAAKRYQDVAQAFWSSPSFASRTPWSQIEL